MKRLKLSEFIKYELEVIKGDIPEEEYLHVFDVAYQGQEDEIKCLLWDIKSKLSRLHTIQDECWST